MNFITNLSLLHNKKKAYNLILVIVNQFTKMICYISICKTINISKLTDIYINYIMQAYSILQFIITD